MKLTVLCFLCAVAVASQEHVQLLHELLVREALVREAVASNFGAYTTEKAMDLIVKRYNPKLVPWGLIMFFHLVRHDLHCGKDGFTGEQLQASPVGVFAKEVVAFAHDVRGEEFAMQVNDIFERNQLGARFDIENLHVKCD
jgi:hypothetical protein